MSLNAARLYRQLLLQKLCGCVQSESASGTVAIGVDTSADQGVMHIQASVYIVKSGNSADITSSDHNTGNGFDRDRLAFCRERDLTVIVSVFVLGLAFAFVNVSGEQISERMRKSGEYIYGVYPGQETSAYINHLVLRLGFIGALYMLFMAGAPMLIILVNPDYLQLSMIPGTFLIFSGMIYNVNEEMKALKLNTSYTPLFENV